MRDLSVASSVSVFGESFQLGSGGSRLRWPTSRACFPSIFTRPSAALLRGIFNESFHFAVFGDEACTPHGSIISVGYFFEDVMEHSSSVGRLNLVDILAEIQGRDDEGKLVFNNPGHILFQPRVPAVHELIERKRCERRVQVGARILGVRLRTVGQPLVQPCRGACNEC